MSKILNAPFDDTLNLSSAEFEELQEVLAIKKADKIYNEIKRGKRNLLSLEEFKKRLDNDVDV